MRIGYLDCFSGVAGDMWVGALLDLGVPLSALQAAVASLDLPGVTIRQERVQRAGIAACRFLVDVVAAPPHHHHDHAHHAHRHLADIRTLLARADVPAGVRAQCEAVFLAIAEVEARQHGTGIEQVHFHEVGAEDTIVDVLCACLGTHLLGLERLYSSAVAVGSGTVRCEHGVLPVPAPGTLDLLYGMPVRQGGLLGERTTPTGAALLKVLVAEFEPQFTWLPGARGHGAGARDDDGQPNLLRLVVGELPSPGSATSVHELCCQLDTADGEAIGWLLDELLRRGALDAYATAVVMKKGRPGFLLTAICDDGCADPLATFLLEESSSLGVRRQRLRRDVLERWQERRQTPFGEVAFKVARLPSGRLLARPEDDEVRRLCAEHGLPRAEALRRLLPD